MARSSDPQSGFSEWDEKRVFLQALSLPPSERKSFLDSICPDESSKARVETLLRHHERADEEFLTIQAPISEHRPSQPIQIDEFRIIHRLGEGGMGVVYLAEDTILGRKVALKVLANHLVGSEQAIARFRDEARNAASLKHPAIVPVHRFGHDGQTHYLVTEYVDGETLANLILRKRKVHKLMGTSDIRAWHRQAAEIIVVIADALDCAHRSKIVHRDVKPSNILLDREHGPRLADFGIAKHLVEDDRTQTALVGSCHYMSPEQASISGKAIDQRSDIFSLGTVLYELLVLQLPFDGPNMHSILHSVSECTPPRLRSLDKRISVDMETICHKAMEKHPIDRYQSSAHVAADLRSYMAGDPILARPPGPAQRITRFLKRHVKAAIAIASVLLVGLVIHLLTEQWQSEQAKKVTIKLATNEPLATATISNLTDGKSIAMGSVSETYTIPPGRYRVCVTIPTNDSFGERTLNALTPGHEYQLSITISQANQFASDMLRFETGNYKIGLPNITDGLEKERVVYLKGFQIDRSEVSVASYRKFLEETRRPLPYYGQLLEEWNELPVVGVTYLDAEAYSAWCGKRLPTAEEWEAAARAPDGRLLPWGADTTPIASNAGLFEIYIMGSSQESLKQYALHVKPCMRNTGDITHFGLLHMFGNVIEITDSIDDFGNVIMKGAAWYQSSNKWNLARTWTMPQIVDNYKLSNQFNSGSSDRGFRCAKSITVD